MSKKKTMKTEEKISSPDASLPEDKPGSTEMSPPVQDAPTSEGTLKRGIAMEKIDSPRFGVPSQSTPGRAAAGGGAANPSAQVGRSPDNPSLRGAGSDPLNKMDIRDEFSWDDIGAQQYKTLIDGSAAGFSPDPILGNYTFEDNLVFQFDNAGEGPGVMNRPYRRRVTDVSKDQCIFVTGQHDDASKAGITFYPDQTYGTQRQIVDVASPAVRSNYLMRGMQINVTKSAEGTRISSISFDTVRLRCESSANDLDVRQDNARVIWDVADRDITETYFNMVNEAANLQANKYSPLPDGQPQAMQHLILSRDVAVTDGAIAMTAIRSAMETYAYHRSMRSEYGSGDGAEAQARMMLGERTAPEWGEFLWADNADMIGAPEVSAHTNGTYRLSMPDYIMSYLDSPTKYKNSIGVWLTQPRALRMLFEQAQKSFDSCGFVIDKDSYHILNDIMGWHDLDGRMAGVNKIGLIVPVDYNQLYEKTENVIVPDADGLVHGVYKYVDYVLNGSIYNVTEVRSPLVDAILQVVKYRIIPKVSNYNPNGTYNFYVPFDFGCNHYSFGNAILMEAMAYVHQFLHSSRAIFQRFQQQYGADPLVCDLTQELKLADVMAGSSYKGIGADQVLPAASEGLRLLMQIPEVYQTSVVTWDSLLELPNALVSLKFTDVAPITDSIDEPQKVLFPMLYKTETMGVWRRVKDLGPLKLLKSRDFPIHRYAPSLAKFTRNSDDLVIEDGYDDTIPFFEFQAPQAYVTDSLINASLALTIADVLKAPRYMGRLTPAPMGMLDFIAKTSGVDNVYGNSMSLYLSKSDDSPAVIKYGWRAVPDDEVIDIHGNVAGTKLNIINNDIENYRVNFIYMPQYNMNTLGQLLRRYAVHFDSGLITPTSLAQLQNTYHVYVNPDQMITVESPTGASFDSNTAMLPYQNIAARLWVNDNVLEFMYSPFTGVTRVAIDDEGEYAEVDTDLMLPMCFGLAGYQGLYYDRLNVDIYGQKQAVGGRIYSNEIMQKDNVFFT